MAVLINKTKRSMFTVEERIDMLTEVTAQWPNVRVDSFHGLLVDYCREHDVHAIVKGLRAVTDFDYELQMAQMNQRLSGVDTLFMSTNPEYSFLSSSLIKEVATFGGDVSSPAARVRAPAAAGAHRGRRLTDRAGRDTRCRGGNAGHPGPHPAHCAACTASSSRWTPWSRSSRRPGACR